MPNRYGRIKLMPDHTLESDDAAEIDLVFAMAGRAALRMPRAMVVGIILGWSLASVSVSSRSSRRAQGSAFYPVQTSPVSAWAVACVPLTF